MTKSNLNISKRNFLIGLSSISIGSGTILSSSQKVDASITVQGGIDNVTANTSTGEVSDIYFPTDKLSFDISWNNMTNLDDSVTLNIYSKLDSDGDYDMIDTSEFLFPNEKNGSVIFENISWVDNNKLQTPLSLIDTHSTLSSNDFTVSTDGSTKVFNMYILFEFDHSAFNHEIEIPVDINITFEETYLEYGLRDDFSGTKLNNRLNQKEGKYNTGSIIWDNAWLRPDWTPETTGTYSMNDGYISVTNNDASIRAPTVNVDVTDGFRMKIDMRHNRRRGRMNFELGRIEDGTWTTIFKITNNAGNSKLAGLVYINGNTNTIYSSTKRTYDDTWYTYEISYDGNTWRFKRNSSTLGTASFSTPNKEPTHMQLRNSADDGEGGLWRNLYIDSEY